MTLGNSNNPMDLNRDGNVSNIELQTALKELNNATNQPGRKKHPVLSRILLGAAFLVLILIIAVVGYQLIRFRMYDVLIIGGIIAAICFAYIISILVKAHKINKLKKDL